MDLDGKTTLITGGGRGIGEALARRFHAGGASVVVADLTGAQDVAAQLDGAVGLSADVSSEAGNVAMIDAAVEAVGPIDLFFANAGVAEGFALDDTDEATWERSFAINVHAHRWAAKRLVPDWLERGDGYFCSTASAAGLLIQIGSVPYTLTKRAAVSFAEWMAVTYGDRGIKVSCLCPQGVRTAMLDQTTGAPNGADIVKAAGAVLEPADVADIVTQAIVEEQFLILPHPEVHRYMQHKAADPARWLAGMRRLQATVLNR
jgi:NAD(P)-dependent dehydrogenase (short-subunit alcohol dehydrogenase family)